MSRRIHLSGSPRLFVSMHFVSTHILCRCPYVPMPIGWVSTPHELHTGLGSGSGSRKRKARASADPLGLPGLP